MTQVSNSYKNPNCKSYFSFVSDRKLPETETEPFTDEGVKGLIAGYGNIVPYKVN